MAISLCLYCFTVTPEGHKQMTVNLRSSHWASPYRNVGRQGSGVLQHYAGANSVVQ